MQLPVRRPSMIETTCLGAAYAAGIGIGIWTVKEIFNTPLENETYFQPEMSLLECRSKYEKWTAAVRKSFDVAG
jgi:glycerol kinase